MDSRIDPDEATRPALLGPSVTSMTNECDETPVPEPSARTGVNEQRTTTKIVSADARHIARFALTNCETADKIDSLETKSRNVAGPADRNGLIRSVNTNGRRSNMTTPAHNGGVQPGRSTIV
jgi:hypothetical protein